MSQSYPDSIEGNTEKPVLFITYGRCVSLLRQVLSASRKNEISVSPRRVLLFSKTLGVVCAFNLQERSPKLTSKQVDTGWIERTHSALSSKDELRQIIQQTRSLTPEQLICSRFRRHESETVQAAKFCIEGFTVLYILARVWTLLDLSVPAITVSMHHSRGKAAFSHSPSQNLCRSSPSGYHVLLVQMRSFG